MQTRTSTTSSRPTTTSPTRAARSTRLASGSASVARATQARAANRTAPTRSLSVLLAHPADVVLIEKSETICSNRGTCSGQKCECTEGYISEDCGSRECPNNCSNDKITDPSLLSECRPDLIRHRGLPGVVLQVLDCIEARRRRLQQDLLFERVRLQRHMRQRRLQVQRPPLRGRLQCL